MRSQSEKLKVSRWKGLFRTESKAANCFVCISASDVSQVSQAYPKISYVCMFARQVRGNHLSLQRPIILHKEEMVVDADLAPFEEIFQFGAPTRSEVPVAKSSWGGVGQNVCKCTYGKQKWL